MSIDILGRRKPGEKIKFRAYSQHGGFQQLIKATVSAESSIFYLFTGFSLLQRFLHMSQVVVALFPSFQHFYHFTFPGIPLTLTLLEVVHSK
jgi:hypothetical protein